MASAIRNQRRVIDQAIIEAVAAEVVLQANPDIEDQPVVFDAFTRANAVLIRPHLEALVASYRGACQTNSGRLAAQLFLSNMLEAEV